MDEEFWKSQTEHYHYEYYKQLEITASYRKVVDDLIWLLNEKTPKDIN